MAIPATPAAPLRSKARRGGREVRQRPAKPRTPVRIRSAPLARIIPRPDHSGENRARARRPCRAAELDIPRRPTTVRGGPRCGTSGGHLCGDQEKGRAGLWPWSTETAMTASGVSAAAMRSRSSSGGSAQCSATTAAPPGAAWIERCSNNGRPCSNAWQRVTPRAPGNETSRPGASSSEGRPRPS